MCPSSCQSLGSCSWHPKHHPTSLSQLEEALEIFSAPPVVEFDDDDAFKYYLPEELLWEVDRVHMRNRLPIFASDRTLPDRPGQGEIGENIP